MNANDQHFRPVDGVIIVGAGLEGAALGEHCVTIGLPTYIATRKGKSELQAELQSVVPGAIATELAEIPTLPASYVVILAVPLSAVHTISPDALANRIVIDVGNYWPRLDSASAFAASPRDSSLLVAQHFSASTVVKTLNHMAHLDISFDARDASDPYRRAQGIATDDDGARVVVADFVNRLGFDPVDAGPLTNGRYFGPGTEIFNGGWRTATEMTRIIARSVARAERDLK